MSQEFHRDYLLRLPLPLAQLYIRAYNAKDVRGRHDNTYYLFEALVKLMTAPAIACYLQGVGQGSPRVAALDQLLTRLALPSLGDWVAMLRQLTRHFGERPDAGAHPLGHLWQQLNTPHRDHPAMLSVFRRIKNGPDGESGGDQSCSILQLIEALVQYRNEVFGHGGPRFESFYVQEMGPLLFPAVNEILAEGTLDLLGPRGSRLVYLSEIRTVDQDRVEVGLRELVNLQGERLSPLELSAAQAVDLLPNRVAVLWPGQRVPLRLHPLLQYRESETAEEVLFLNRDRKGRQVEYLSYSTGRTERDRTSAAALASLLSLIGDRPVAVEELQPAEGSTPTRALGDYEILAEIDQGGMGVVCLARQSSLGRLVALKMLRADMVGDEVALARFRREIRSLAQCDHPNIVKVLSSGTLPDGQVFYTMEYVPGSDLESVWRELAVPDSREPSSMLGQTTWTRAVLTASRKRQEKTRAKTGRTTAGGRGPDNEAEPLTPDAGVLPLPPLPDLPAPALDPGGYVRRVAQLIRDAALALQAVHDQGIVHRDVKPANLILTPDASRVVLMDFGLAKSMNVALTASQSGGFLGTLRYAAPEQLAAAMLKVGPQADVRGLGVVLWELLTRRRLFGDAEDERQLAVKIHEQDVPLLRSIDPKLDRDLEAIVARATERRATDRILTAGKLAEYLQLYLDGQPLPIRPPTMPEFLWRWVRQHKPLVGSAALALAAILATVTTAFFLIVSALDRESTAHGLAQQRAIDESLAKSKEAAARQEADEQKAFALTQLDLARAQLYFNHITLAQREHAALNVARAQELLDQCPPSLRHWEWYFLKRLYQRSRFTLLGHNATITSVAYSPDGLTLASAGEDNTIRLWDAGTGQEIATWKHPGPTALAFSPDGRRLASAHKDGSVRISNVADGRQVFALPKHTVAVNCIAFSPDGRLLVSGSDDKTIKVWDVLQGQEIRSFEKHKDSVLCLAFSPDGTHIASAGRDHEIRIWETATGIEELHFFPGDPLYLTSVSYSPDGKRLASAGWNTAINIWDVHTGKNVLALGEQHVKGDINVAYSPDGKRLGSVGRDRTVRVRNAVTGKEPMVLLGHTDHVTCLSFSPDGQMLATGGHDQTIKVWSLAQGPEKRILPGHRDSVLAVACSPDSQRLASASFDRTITLWNALTGRVEHHLTGHDATVTDVAFRPGDGRYLASGSGDGTLKIWEAATGKLVRTCTGHTGMVNALAYRGDGKHLASAGEDQTVKIWDADTGLLLRSFDADSERVLSVAYSPDGQRLAAAGNDKIIIMWDPATGKVEQTLKGHLDAVVCLRFSPNGQHLASASWDKTVKIWNASTGQEIFTLRGHVGTLTGIAYSDDGKRLVSMDRENNIKIWEAHTGQEILSLTRAKGPALGATFSADHQRLALACRNDCVEIWLGTPLGSLPKPAPPVVHLTDLSLRRARGLEESKAVSGKIAFQALAQVPGPAVLRLSYTVEGKTRYRFYRLGKEMTGAQPGAKGEIPFSFAPLALVEEMEAKNYSGPLLLVVELCRPAEPGSGREEVVLSNRASAVVQVVALGQLPARPRERFTFQEHAKSVLAIAFAPDGKSLASADVDGQVKIWDTATGKKQAEFHGYKKEIRSLAYSRDGKNLLFGSVEGTIKVWDLARNEAVLTLQGHKEVILCVRFSPDGKTLASASKDGTVKLWDAATWKLQATLQGNKSQLHLAFSPTSPLLAAVDGYQFGDDRVQLWNLETRKRRPPLHDIRVGVVCVEFAPNGKTLALGGHVGNKTGRLLLYDLASRRQHQSLPGHSGMVACLAFSPQNRILASGSYDRTVKLWDWVRGTELATLTGHEKAILAVAFSPAGNLLATASSDHTVKLWDLAPDDEETK